MLDRVLRNSERLPLSYDAPGITVGTPPPGYNVAEERHVIGHGPEAFGRAVHALQQWRQFDLGWVSAYPRDAPLRIGTNVVVVARHLGLWSINACRILCVAGDGSRDVSGFTYGTLTEHAEIGEEIFHVSQDPSSGEVTYLIRAVSREGALLAKLGFPAARAMQRRFRRDSAAVMRQYVATAGHVQAADGIASW
jgi:uncharacterized protein (UPF0548 family)